MSTAAPATSSTLLGHPTGLFNLFFAEMWERFSYYGMRALLVFYMIKGFLGYGDKGAYAVYGAYTALVYMTPFFGGILADQVLGARRAVILGGVLMSLGHLTMTIEHETAFYVALGMLIVGNGFFKPNISTMVGSLYPEGSGARDAGFTLFYMGINLGAALAPLLCGYVGETFGWHYGFGLATIGMMIGLAVFVVPNVVSQLLIGLGGLLTAGAMLFITDDLILLAVNGFVGLALVVAAGVSVLALSKGGMPDDIGAPPANAPPNAIAAVIGGSIVVIPLLAWLVAASREWRLIPDAVIAPLTGSGNAALAVAGAILGEMATPAGAVLFLSGFAALGFIAYNAMKGTKVERERLSVVVILMFFSMLFWAFFEQAGTSINNFTDRNVDRVRAERVVTAADVGQTLEIPPTQAQLGYSFGGTVYTLDQLDGARAKARESGAPASLSFTVEPAHVGMKVDGNEIPASTFQSTNPVFILLFGLGFSSLWAFLGARGLEPNTSLKFALGLAQLGLGFGALWYGATMHDARGMVGMSWLILGYLLHTTGELCLSPVGLSAMTRLAPTRIVSTVMGAWFLATAYSSLLSAIIATFTGIGHGGGDEKGIPAPIETVEVYGAVFGQIGIACAVSVVFLLGLSPFLTKWMHEDKHDEGAGKVRAAH